MRVSADTLRLPKQRRIEPHANGRALGGLAKDLEDVLSGDDHHVMMTSATFPRRSPLLFTLRRASTRSILKP